MALIAHDLFYKDPKDNDKTIIDNRRRAFKDSVWDNTYSDRMKENRELFLSGSPLSDISYSTRFNSKEMQVLNSSAQANKLYDIVSSGKGNIYSFDTETIGNVLDLAKGESYATITEFGIGKISGDSQDLVSVVFGLNKEQGLEAADLVNRWVASGKDVTQFTGQELSTLDRFSRYAGSTSMVTKREIEGIGKVATIKGLSESNIYSETALYQGVGYLMGVGGVKESDIEYNNATAKFRKYVTTMSSHMERSGIAPQRIGDDYGNKVFQGLMDFVKEKSMDINSVVTGYNFNYDLVAMKNQAKKFGLDFKLSKEDYVDPYYSILAMSKSNAIDEGSPLAITKKIANYSDVDFDARHPGTLETMASINGIEISAHHAGSDSLATGKLASMENFLNDSDGEARSFPELLKETIDAMKQKDLDSFNPLENHGAYKPVLYANSAVAKNERDYAYSFINGQMETSPSYLSYGLSRGNIYSVNGIVEIEDGYMVDFRSASKKGEHGMMKYYSDLDELEDSFKSDFTSMYTGSRIPGKNSPIRDMYISQKDIDLQRTIWETDVARREFESFYDSAWTSVTKSGKDYGGFSSAEKYYNILKDIRENNIDLTDKKVRKAMQVGDYDDLLFEIASKHNGNATNVRNFKNMTGQLLAEEGIYSEVSSFLSSKPEYSNLNNFEKTLIAENYRNTLIKGMESEGNVSVAMPTSKAQSPWKSASVRDLKDWDVLVDGKYTRVSIESGDAFAKDIVKQANQIAKHNYPDRVKSSYGYGGARNLQKDVDAFRVLKDFTISNIVENDNVPLNDRTKNDIVKLLDSVKGNVTGTSNYAIASEIGSMLEQNNLTLNTSGVNLNIFRGMNLGEEGSYKGISDDTAKFFMNKNVLDKGFGKEYNIAGYNSNSMLNGKKYLFGNRKQSMSLYDYGVNSGKIDDARKSLYNTYSNLNFTTNLREEFNTMGTFYQEFKDKMGFTDENMKTLAQAIYYNPSKDGKSTGGLDTINSGENQTKYFTSIMLSEDTNKAYIISTKTDKAQEIISTLHDSTIGEREKIDRLRGTGDYLPTDAKAVVWEINGINRRGNAEITPEGLINSDSSVVQGKNGYERIVKNYISEFDSKGELTLKFQNNYDDIIKTLLIRKESLKEMMDNNEYYQGTRLLERGANDKLMKMSAYSGYQTMMVDGVPTKVRVPNVADLLQSQELKGIEVLKDVVFKFASEGKEGDERQYMRDILSMFALDKDRNQQKNYLDPTNLKTMYETKAYDHVALEDYFTRHLFNGNFSDEKGTFSSKHKGTFIDFLNEFKTEKTSEVISYLYDNRETLSQIVKETAATEGYLSLINKMEYDAYGNLAATQRPTNIQELGMTWYDKESAKEYYDADELLSKDITFGNVVDNKNILELKKDYDDEIGKNIKIPTSQLEQNMTGYVKQMSDLEISMAYEKLNQMDLTSSIQKYTNLPVSDEQHKAMVESMDELFRDTFVSTHESAEFILPVFANQEHFSSGEIHTIHRRPLNDLSKDVLKANLEKSNGIIKKGDLLGYDENKKKMFYDGPEGLVTNLDEFAETGDLKVLPSRIETGSVKLGHYAEKATGHTLRFDVDDARYKPFIIRDNAGKIDLKATNQLINHYSSEYFYNLTGDRKAVIAANMALGKHTSGDVVYGGFINRLSLEYKKTGNIEGYNNLMSQFSLQDYLHFNSDGTFVNDVSKAPMATMNNLDNLYEYINKNQTLQKEFGSTITNYLDDVANNRVLTGIARSKLQDTLGDVVAVNDKMAQILRLAGKDNLGPEGLTDANSILMPDGTRKMFGDYIADMLTIDRKLSPADIGARKTVQGVRTALDYALNPDDLVGTSKAVKINIGDVYIPKSGSKFDDLSESFLMTNGKVSDFIRSKANNAFVEDINVAVLDISEFKKGFTYDLGEAKGLTSIAIPLIDMTPVNGEVVYTPMQSSINHVIQMVQNTNSKEEIEKAVVSMYETFAREISGSTDSYMNKKIIKSIHRNGAQIQAQRSITNAMNFLVKNPELATKDNLKIISAAVEKATTEGMDALKGLKLNGKAYDLGLEDVSLYDARKKKLRGYQGVYMREVNDKLQLDNVIEFSEKAMADAFNINFLEVGRDVMKNIEHGDVLSTIKGIDVTQEMLDNYQTELENILKPLNFDLTKQDLASKSLINDLYTKSLMRDFDTLSANIRNGSELLEITDQLLQTNKKGDINKIVKEAKQFVFKNTKGIYSNSEVDEIFDQILNRGLETTALTKKGLEEVGKMYLEDYGILGNTTRHPTFNEGHSGIVTYRLNRSLEGQSSIQVPWLAEIQKLDFDGDTKFDIPFVNRRGGLLLNGKDDDALKSLNALYLDLSSKQGFYYAKQLETMTKAEEANILSLKFKFDMLSKWGIDKEYNGILYKEEDIKALVDAAEKGDKSATKTLTSLTREWVKDYGNMIKNKEVIMSSIKAKVTKGNIGYISNVNYAVRDSLLGSYNDLIKNGGDSTLLNRIKSDLSKPGPNLLNITEQEGIDTKHVFDALGTAETMKYQKAVNSLMSSEKAPTVNMKKAAVRDIYDAVGSKLFKAKDLESIPLESGKSIRGQIIDRVVTMNYEDLSEKERWLRSLLDLSDMKVARDSFNSILATGKISKKDGVSQFISSLIKGDKTLLGTRAGHVIMHTDYGEIERVGYYHKGSFEGLDKSNFYFSNNNAYALKNLEAKKGKYTATFDIYNLGKQRGSSFNKESASEIISTNSIKELNEKLTEKFGEFKGASKVGVIRDSSYRKQTIDMLVNEKTKNQVRTVTRNLNDYVKPNTKDLDSITLSANMKTSQFMDLVSKKDLRTFNRRVNYIAKNNIPLVDNRKFSDSVQMHGALLDEINEAIIADGAKAKEFANNNGFTNVFDYYFNKLVTPITNIPNVLGEEYATASTKTVQDIVADYRKNSYNVEKTEARIDKIYDNIVKDNNYKSTEAISNLEKIRIQKINESSQMDAVNQLRQLIRPTNINSDVQQVLNPSGSLSDSIVGYGKYFGEDISALSKSQLKEILDMEVKTDDMVLSQIIKVTKENAKIASEQATTTSRIVGGSLEYSVSDSQKLIYDLNEQIIEEGKKTTSKMKDAKAASSDTAEKVISKSLNATDDFKSMMSGKGKYVGYAVAGLAALGIANQMLHKDRSNPLTPDQTPKPQTTVRKLNIKNAKDNSLKKTKVIYDGGGGAGINISAKGARKLNHKQMAQNIGATYNRNTSVDVHTYDDTSQVSNNWLERKFAELM